jgi:tetraacyldisaccharide 4'-kinase
MLDHALNGGADGSPVFLRADPNRAAAGAALLAEHPEVDVVLLDDGFQHRRVGRDLDVVLINAAEPFGFDHVLPRGLLREPLAGLRRAGVVVLTRCDRVGEQELLRIEQRVREFSSATVARSVHSQTGFRQPGTPLRAPVDQPMSALVGRSWFLFVGIANPDGLRGQLQAHGGRCVGSRPFPDHHAYTSADVREVVREATDRAADVLVTTEKDWVKLEPLWASAAETIPLWRVDVEVRFLGDGASVLSGLAESALAKGQR